MRKLLNIIAPIFVIALGIGAVVALNEVAPEPEKKDEKPRPTSVYVDEVRRESVILSVDTYGEVRAKNEIDLIPQVTGLIVSMADNFAEGASFKPGETLIKIDPDNYQLAVTSAEARVAEARVKLEQELADASIKEKQWKAWVKDGEPTPLALNKPQVAEAQAKVRAAVADLDNARLDLKRTNITVPFNGRVLTRGVGVGQFVTAGTKLGRVFSTDVVEVKLPLTDQQFADLNLPLGFVAGEGAAPSVKLKARIGGRDHTWQGSIVRTHAAIDNETRLIYAVAAVNDPYGAASSDGMPLAVGVFVNAEIDGVAPTNALVMSRYGLRNEDTAYVITDNKLSIRKVQVLSSNAETVLISSGLNVGDKVVTSPLVSPVDGMPVTPILRTASNSLQSN